MRTLEEIKEQYATSLNDDYETYTWQSLISGNGTRNMEHHHDAVAKLYAKEVAKEALKNAADKSQDMMYYVIDEVDGNIEGLLRLKRRTFQPCYAVPKQTVLSESNIPKL